MKILKEYENNYIIIEMAMNCAFKELSFMGFLGLVQ